MSNRLAGQASPYLRQHADNPVDWWPWCEEAFDEARRRDVPVLLSVGYSSCHWCHVMAHESFEDPTTASQMNADFVNIKVDREVRPDIDTLYMDAVTAMTGRGGWPMTVFLDHDGRPFFGGTYFPPYDRPGMPSFASLMAAISEAWQENRDEIAEQAAKLAQAITPPSVTGTAGPDPAVLDGALQALQSNYDFEHGGFGAAPKFPHVMNLTFCLAKGYPKDDRTLAIVSHSLKAMALGGIYDQIGGGFARYSVDERWEVPHFEKMLYDNAQLARLYLWAGVALDSPFFERIATEVLDYLAREMLDESGGFYSATDADSEDVEGKFFVWGYDEFVEIAGEELTPHFGVTRQGNFEGTNVLTAACELEALSSEERSGVVAAREALYERRTHRTPPSTDDKIICAWNGLAISAFADAGRVLGREDYQEIALKCGEFSLAELHTNGELLRIFGDSVPAFAGDYALLGLGYLSLFEATGDWRWVDESARLASALFSKFGDERDGLLFSTCDETLIARPKEVFDNAEPSASAAGAELALRLAVLTGEQGLAVIAEKIATSAAELIERAPSGFGAMLLAIARQLSPPVEIVVFGDELVAEASKRYMPFANLVTGAQGAHPKNPLLDGKDMSRPVGYVCRNYACEAPVYDLTGLRGALDQTARSTMAGHKGNSLKRFS